MYNTSKLEEFMNVFVKVIKSALNQDRQSPFTKRTINFIVLVFKKITSHENEMEEKRLQQVVQNDLNGINDSNEVETMEENEEDDLLYGSGLEHDTTIVNDQYVSPISWVDFFIKNSLVTFLEAKDINVRQNTVLLLKKTLEIFNEIDENTYSALNESLCDVALNKDKKVRAYSALALEKIQNLGNNAQNTLNFLMIADTNPLVRLCALKVIDVNENTLKNILKSTRSENVLVRKMAYKKIATHCKLENFPTEDRYNLLVNGTNERDESVRELFITKLIPKFIGDSVFSFLEATNYKKDSKLYEKLFFSYFDHLYKTAVKTTKNQTKFHQLALDFRKEHLNEHRLIDFSSLTNEKAYFWYMLCYFCKKSDITLVKTVENSEEENDEDVTETVDLLDEILPDIPYYCDYIERFTSENLENPKKFIFKKLIQIGQFCQIIDSTQWNFISSLFKKWFLEDRYFAFTEPVIEDMISIYSNYYKNENEKLLDEIYDLINSLNYSNNDDNVTANQEENLEEKLKAVDDKLAEKCELESKAVIENDEESVEQIKKEVDQLIESREKIINVSEISNSTSKDNCPRIETDYIVYRRCLQICYGFFISGELKRNMDRLPKLISIWILPGLNSGDSKIRTFAVKTLGRYCFPSTELINDFLKVFIEIIDEENYNDTRVEALTYLFDFLCFHGFDDIKFIDNDHTLQRDKSIPDKTNILERCKDSGFIEVFTDLLDKFLQEPVHPIEMKRKNLTAYVEHNLFEITVKSLCKIMDMGRFYAAGCLSKLIVINFVYKNVNLELKQFIQGFFYIYSRTFKNRLRDRFEVSNPFVDCYEDCLNILDQLNYLDSVTEKGELIDFFVNLSDDDQSALIVKVVAMLDDENKKFWEFNLKTINKCDLSSLTNDQLNLILDQLLEFSENFSQYMKTGKSKRSRRTNEVDKNAELVKKIIAKAKKLESKKNNTNV
ncbi:hypothetical protein RDWZM_003537 [Blomia tropicalis]|uniref:Nuclear condensin complex subunit 3 C-terminal domain-containing protein n=1 Tax=Blomia tropicalis TaxID=40697 RepID=A0A9Q0MFZ8_BLOTA|nr:hypothetical protein RDWZM_003537 [Blomia tropicalis]